jgi:predicted dienelactone hydrolase
MHSGFQHLHIADPVFGGTFPATLQYPTSVAPAGVMLHGLTWDATLDAPLLPGRRFPVCVISHGAGGSHLLYRTIATPLAAAGWIVVCPEAPRDNRNDRSLSYTDQAVTNRCIHLRATLDSVLAHDTLGPAADASRVGLVGHSLGGCAALALAGGQPGSRQRSPIPVQADDRFRAAVLMAPATAYYRAPDALAKVSIPLLVLAGEKDDITPADDIRATLKPLPAANSWDFVMVRGAGHFSFLSPFPPELRRPDFPPSQDPEGFDREEFHQKLPGIVETFLTKALPAA